MKLTNTQILITLGVVGAAGAAWYLLRGKPRVPVGSVQVSEGRFVEADGQCFDTDTGGPTDMRNCTGGGLVAAVTDAVDSIRDLFPSADDEFACRAGETMQSVGGATLVCDANGTWGA